MTIVCVRIISFPCQQRPLFLGLLQYQEKEAASSKDKCSYSITIYNTKQLEQSCFFTPIIIDYKERLSKASFVIGQLYTCTFFAYYLSKRPSREYSERKSYTEWAFTKKVKCCFFSVYSHINTDYKITVPQKRKSTQSTSTVMNKFFYAQLKPLTQYNGSNSCTMKM